MNLRFVTSTLENISDQVFRTILHLVGKMVPWSGFVGAVEGVQRFLLQNGHQIRNQHPRKPQ